MTRRKGRQQVDPTISRIVEDPAVTSLVERSSLRWHRGLGRRARISRYLFRASGVSVLLLSASLPLVAATDYHDNRLIVASLGSAIAIISALNTFYRWGDRWRIYRRAELEIEGAMRQWEADVVEGSILEELTEQQRNAWNFRRTLELLNRTRAITENQHLAFFEALQLTLPQVGQPTGGPPDRPDQPPANQLGGTV